MSEKEKTMHEPCKITDEMLDAGAGEISIILDLEDGPYFQTYGQYARRVYLAMAALDPDRKPGQS